MTKNERKNARLAEVARTKLAALDDKVLERRKEEVERQRKEREALLLQQEKEKYGLIKQYKPLSEMVA